MNAPVCDGCGVALSPMVMRWTGVDADYNEAGDYVACMGPMCPSCAPKDAETINDADVPGFWPTDADLLDWATSEGMSTDAFAEEAVERSGLAGADLPAVPYGDTMVSWPGGGPSVDDVPSSVLVDVANEWWCDGRIDWMLDDEPAEPWRVLLRDTIDGVGQVHARNPSGWKPGKGDVLVEACATREDADAYTVRHADPASGSYVGNLLRDGIPVGEAVRRVYRIEKADRTMSLRLVGTTTPRST